ncbi:hypothetical protein PVAG01_10258 [Phlyctema vagabunda]|uniref:Uncharacterized protein n=1 Tax=Phlyctema vagabunda TaxID=108571 RepID=A0ABR4P5K6_9HELO
MNKNHSHVYNGEGANAFPGLEVLDLKRQLEMVPPLLGIHPESVLKGNTTGERWRDYKVAFDFYLANENEKELLLGALENFDQKDRPFQMQHLLFSNKHRFVQTTTNGHNIHQFEPALIAREVR